MAEKRFYWLKLKEDYFNNPKIKKLRRIAGGDTFTIVYLKMQLLSVSNKGIIEYEGIEPSIEEELALKLDEDLDNVGITLNYLKLQGLIESNDNEFLLLEACKNIGSESDSAERVRLFREREKQKALQCNADVTQVLQSSISISNSISNINNNNKQSKKEAFDNLINSFTENEEERELLAEWLKVRKAKRAAMTTKAIELNLNKLRELANKSNMSIVEYLKEVICRGWQAFYEIKNYKINEQKKEKNKWSVSFSELYDTAEEIGGFK